MDGRFCNIRKIRMIAAPKKNKEKKLRSKVEQGSSWKTATHSVHLIKMAIIKIRKDGS